MSGAHVSMGVLRPAAPASSPAFSSVSRTPWSLLDLYRRLDRDPLGTFADLARHGGDLVEFHAGPVRVLLLSGPSHIADVLVAQQRQFVKPRGPLVAARVLGAGLLTTEGAIWRRSRRLIQPAFHRQVVAGMDGAIVAAALHHIRAWHPGEMRDVADDMSALSFAIAAENLFGADVEAVHPDLLKNLARAMRHAHRRAKAIVRWPGWLPTPDNRSFMLAVRQLDAAVTDIIAQRAPGGAPRHDVLAALMAAVDADGWPLTPQELRDHTATLLLAGHETTATTLSWLWHLLGAHPEVRARLEQELDQVLDGARPTAADVDPRRLPYLNAVIAEVLRLYPPVWVMARRAIAPVALGAHTYPAGTWIIMSPWVVHRDERLYPEAGAFRPERWLDLSHGRQPPLAYFPFGAGPRMCIGKPFALTEIALVTAVIAQRFRCEPATPGPVAVEPLITLRPQHGIRVTISAR